MWLLLRLGTPEAATQRIRSVQANAGEAGHGTRKMDGSGGIFMIASSRCGNAASARAARALALAACLCGCASAPPALPVSRAYRQAGAARLLLADDPRGAAYELTRAIEFDPRDAGLYALRAFAHRKAGDAAAAEADFRKAMELQPGLRRALEPLLR